MQPGFGITLEATDGAARAGTLATWHGSVPTPLFMPVATLATVKGVDIGRVAETGAGMVLANTYHLHLRPGDEIVEQGGGVAKFMGWSGPTLTDSGGFQVFSLAKQVKVTEEGAFFRSHLDGSPVNLTPEAAVRIQERLGADVAMQLDEVVALPAEKPRYLMGVGQPQDIVHAVAAGIDMFDCVLPTRCGRNSLVYTFAGQVRLRNAVHATDQRPLEEGCPCLACRHSRSYIRHLFLAGEMLGPILASIHNLTFYQRLVARLRAAIVAGRLEAESRELVARFAAVAE